MPRSYSDIISNSMQSDPQHHSFGSRVALRTHGSLNAGHTDRQFSFSAQKSIFTLQRQLHQLHKSKHPDDAVYADEAVRIFNENDRPYFLADNQNTLDAEPGTDILRWLARASYHDVATFAVWNKKRREDVEHQLNRDRPALQDKTLQMVEYLIGESILPQKAIGIYTKSFKHYGEYRAIDSIESGLYNVTGLCDGEKQAYANMYADKGNLTGIDSFFEATVLHESTHGSAGYDRGFWFGIRKQIPMMFIEEAWVTHVENVGIALATGDTPALSNTIDPDRRQDKDAVYTRNCKYLGLIAGNLTTRQIGHAFLSDYEDNRWRARVEDEFIKQSGSARNFFGFVKKYQKADTIAESTKLIDEEIARLEEKAGSSAR